MNINLSTKMVNLQSTFAPYKWGLYSKVFRGCPLVYNKTGFLHDNHAITLNCTDLNKRSRYNVFFQGKVL